MIDAKRLFGINTKKLFQVALKNGHYFIFNLKFGFIVLFLSGRQHTFEFQMFLERGVQIGNYFIKPIKDFDGLIQMRVFKVNIQTFLVIIEHFGHVTFKLGIYRKISHLNQGIEFFLVMFFSDFNLNRLK